MKRKLALGYQEFSKIRKNNCIYVDKTNDIYNLIKNGSYYFLSRPRRFGKSLLINTISEVFAGNKSLFENLWICDKWDWKDKYPVVKISFADIDYKTLGLERAIEEQLQSIANQHKITLNKPSVATKFKELIHKIGRQKEIVILIDEYDKPVIDYMNDISEAEKNRDILKNFYSIIKDADKYIRFLFITGVSKFSQVSIFSDLNNLTDITIDARFATITGFTKEELECNFADYITEIKAKFQNIPNIMQTVKNWYNGYSWDGINKVYNPVSIMNFFAKQQFSNYWFSTGTPTMLIKIIENQQLTAFDIENYTSSAGVLNKYDFKDIDLTSLLFQTGYLTISELNNYNGKIRLNYPNREVAEAFSEHILASQTNNKISKTANILSNITEAFNANKIDKFIKYINQLFKNIPYSIVEDKESYFHSLFYLIMKLIGYEIHAEVLTIDGRIDAVVETHNFIYIIEFKINQSAETAIKQIQNKGYATKYKADSKQVILLGINFETEKMKINDYLAYEQKKSEL